MMSDISVSSMKTKKSKTIEYWEEFMDIESSFQVGRKISATATFDKWKYEGPMQTSIPKETYMHRRHVPRFLLWYGFLGTME